jgi:hypothetical protein
MKDCSNCALCCKLLHVPSLAAAGQWCPHCVPGLKNGCCTIHPDRPDFCRGWHCFWRAENWPDWLRPDKCKVIFEALPGVVTILVSVEPSRPNAWKTKEILEVIEKLRRKGRPLVLKTKNDSEMFIPKGAVQADVLHDIKTVIDWKEKMNGSSDIHD